jgi:hypothetical protein
MAIKSKKSKLEAPSLRELGKRSITCRDSFQALSAKHRDVSDETKLTGQIKKSFRRLTTRFEAVQEDQVDARARKDLEILVNCIDQSNKNIDQRRKTADRRSLILELEVQSCALDLLNDELGHATLR